MQKIGIGFVLLFLFVCSVGGTLHECGEFNKQNVVDSRGPPHQSASGDYFHAFENIDNEILNEVYKLLENLTNVETENLLSSGEPIKYVVSVRCGEIFK